ncbi:MAG: 30S ribosomal protein S12 methylthiotransferase RimO [Acutalibacteraceae bacterium]|nr:30S ribosomal protein S12 methylthiotransferase RimO [Clostridia bacterium]MEE3450513.1 30S ribosomal protein S12 methylthiotransferase RimO [Acutalibacteraceae bacterium]
MPYTVGMVSLGCAKNRVDAEMMLYSLKQAGYKIVEEAAMADVAIINTCGFIESAKQESIDEILELAQLKKEGKIKAIIATGCLAERYREQMMKELYEIDAVVGIGANKDIADVVEKVLEKNKVETFPDKRQLPLEGGRIQSTEFYYAYIKIAEGCDNHCTYCAIPMIRGAYRSRKLESILDEAKNLALNGVKELIIIAQDTTKYGIDIYGEYKLAALLKELCKIDGIEWIRVLYCYPECITDELIEVFANEEKVLKYIDMPLQHCDGAVLKRMNRKGNREELTALINKLRERIPGITLRTTFIAGFPGETEEQFEQLAEFSREIGFERMGCFPYSQEEDTPAAKMPDQIDEDIKQQRADILMEQQQTVMEKLCEKLIDTQIDVITEGFDRYAECYFGRSKADAPEVDGKVFFTTSGRKPSLGEIVKVKITDFLDCDPIGEMVI